MYNEKWLHNAWRSSQLGFTMRSVIVDCDVGTDDALALMVLLAEEHRNPYKIVAITCTYGNTALNNVRRNVMIILEAMQRTDIPVYIGAEFSLTHGTTGTDYHGNDGLGDQNFPDPVAKPQTENAIAAINRITSENKDVSIMCLGPLTNLALALRSYPDLHKNIKDLWIMGGNATLACKVIPSTAEFNFRQDPVAASIVFDTVSCPTTLLPYEPCKNIFISKEWRFNIMGNTNTKHMHILNAAEKNITKERPSWNPCDAFLAALFVNSRVVTSERHVHLAVETQGTYTKGQCLILEFQKPNVRLIDKIDVQLAQEMFLTTAQYEAR